MAVELAHTADEALERFTLISGAGGEESNTACAMTALAWMRGLAWTDAMECAHPLIRSQVIRANDAPGATEEQRAKLVRAGVKGVIDTWWIPTDVVVWSLAQVETDTPTYDRVLAAVKFIGKWKKNKARPDLRSADLSSANLYGADLRSADLSSANLRSANLYGANLRSANLRSANLRSANLYGANLRSADLSSANLRSADLSSANLRSADLSSANLYGADLGATLGNSSTVLPSGYKLTDSGLIVRNES